MCSAAESVKKAPGIARWLMLRASLLMLRRQWLQWLVGAFCGKLTPTHAVRSIARLLGRTALHTFPLYYSTAEQQNTTVERLQ